MAKALAGDPRVTGELRIHALVIIARMLVRIGAAAEDISAMCRRRGLPHLGRGDYMV
jgi:hypothetical protein